MFSYHELQRRVISNISSVTQTNLGTRYGGQYQTKKTRKRRGRREKRGGEG